MSAVKAILIDPYAEKVSDMAREVWVTGSERLKQYYELIGHDCTIVEAAYPDALGGECVYVDEEGLWQQSMGFQFKGHPQPLMGRGIVVGTDDEGNTISTEWTACEVLANIEHLVAHMGDCAVRVRVAGLGA